MDDVVQEIFIVIHGKFHTLERPEALRSWIYSIVRRTVSTHRRAGRTRAGGLTVGEDVELESLGPSPFQQTETNADLALLAQLLGTLDAQKREVFSLVELEEFTVPEVAEALEIPLNTAYSRLRAARQAFEAALARLEKRNKET
jgi:RNA polymerase sigma-70 factor (ECF subfamily)